MMIEYEDHDRTPDSVGSKLFVLAVMSFGLFGMVSGILALARQLSG